MSFWDEDAFEEGGGGGIRFAAVTSEVYFAENDYGLSLRVVSTFDNPELFPDKENGTYTQFYGLGQDQSEWTTKDAGETAVHKANPDKKARKDSDFGRLGEAYKNLDGLRDLRPDFNPYVAESYKGLHLEWARQSYEVNRYVRDENRELILDANGNKQLEKVTKYITLPVALLDGATVAAPADITDLGLSDEDVTALGAAQTDDAFMKVLLERGLTSNAKVMGLVSKDLAGFRAALPF
jgi:hypothetical protein